MADAASKTPKQILEEVLGTATAKLFWTKNYQDAFPLSFDDFDIDAILPAMLYMFRRGFRRGAGQFGKVFGESAGDGKHAIVTMRNVALKLGVRADVEGFEGAVGGNLLADLLLAFSLQNRKHAPGRDEPLIRAFPSHYMASWIDLPISVANLRGVPEMLVALLAQQESGDALDPKMKGRTRFSITHDYAANDLLRVFSAGMRTSDDPQRLQEDFDESSLIGVDQLLTVRIAHEMKEAPRRMTEARAQGSGIPNRRPLAEKAADDFSEDLRIFLRAYGQAIPRQSFLPMLETAFCAGLSNVLLSTAEMLYVWREDGRLPQRREQQETALFVDCSDGGDYALRRASEQSTDECMRRLRAIPAILSMLRILDERAVYRVKSQPLPPHMPSAAARINLLGDLHGRMMKESERTDENIDEWAQKLGEQLRDAGQHEDVVDLLNARQKPAAERLGTAITMLMGDQINLVDFMTAIDSALGMRLPHGLARSRRVHADQTATRRRTRVVRSIVFSDAFLDFAVHRHLFKTVDKQRPLSFVRFLAILRERYGFYVDQAPPGQSISGELLQKNRALLESRLRDLGLLVGVNDAESMKFLRPRFAAQAA
ncbi:MAG: hypothetical protein NTZ50_15985 [Chloroflexi bacterium]|nr:hypothetical protein [Chloroflexota bacterium]